MKKLVNFIKFNLFFDVLIFLIAISTCVTLNMAFPVRIFIGLCIDVLATSIVISVLG